MANIIIPKPRLIVPAYREGGMCGKLAARIQIEKAKCDSEGREVAGTRHVAVPWFKNTITDTGLNAKGTGWRLDCVVGSGTLPITESSTMLGNTLSGNNSEAGDGTNNGSAGGFVSDPVAPYGWKRGTFRFNAGNVVGVISEVGLTIDSARAGLSNPDYSIAMGSLVKDNAGNPTTITKAADELLDIAYEVRLYVKMTDDTYIVNINGVDHTFTTRATAANGAAWSHRIPHATYPSGFYTSGNARHAAYANVTLANIGTVFQDFIGADSISGSLSPTVQPYQEGSLMREIHFNLGPTAGNHANGISGLITSTSVGDYKTVIVPAIPKVLGSNLQLKARWYWDRYVM